MQESYLTHEDNLRLAGEVISVLGAMVILLLEVTISQTSPHLFHADLTQRSPCRRHTWLIFLLGVRQIPDILRVGAKRYFGQTALGGPFHVILCVETPARAHIYRTVSGLALC